MRCVWRFNAGACVCVCVCVLFAVCVCICVCGCVSVFPKAGVGLTLTELTGGRCSLAYVCEHFEGVEWAVWVAV